MYYCEFVKNTYGILSFADVMLGDSIEDASKKLSPYYNSDIEEKFNCIKPSIKGEITPFDDKYIIGASIFLSGNPITSIIFKAHFNSFPYNTFGYLKGMELSISDDSYMELIKEPQWLDKEDGTLFKKERRMQMHNLLCDYHSFVGLESDGFTTIGVKVEFPKHNLKEESRTSVLASYNSINRLVRDYRQELKTNSLLRKGDNNVIVF